MRQLIFVFGLVFVSQSLFAGDLEAVIASVECRQSGSAAPVDILENIRKQAPSIALLVFTAPWCAACRKLENKLSNQGGLIGSDVRLFFLSLEQRPGQQVDKKKPKQARFPSESRLKRFPTGTFFSCTPVGSASKSLSLRIPVYFLMNAGRLDTQFKGFSGANVGLLARRLSWLRGNEAASLDPAFEDSIDDEE
ncbi:MAG: hypothetical protein ACK5P7_09175 [Bdellovibrio sp.]